MAEPGRPQAEEYTPYFERYISLVAGDEVLETLHGQLHDLQRVLGGLSEERAGHRYAAGKWSVREVLGHVVDTERIFGYRALCIARGDQAQLPGFDEQAYAQNAAHDACLLAELLDELEHVRRGHLLLFRHLAPEAWQRRGVANANPVSVRALAFLMAGHAAHHLNVLRDRYGIA